jgi:hypothetical protein
MKVTIRNETPSDVDAIRTVKRVLVAEGPRVYFSLGGRGQEARVFGGVELSQGARGAARVKLSELAKGAARPPMPTRVEVNVTEVAKALDLDG